jgi:hypothetical protein
MLAHGCLSCHLPLSALDYLGASDAIPSLAIGEQSVLAIMHLLLLLLIHVLRDILKLCLPRLQVLPSTPVIH